MPADPDLMAALQSRIEEGDDYARQLEKAVRTWESLDASPQSLLDLNDTHLINETPGGSMPWPAKPPSIEAEILRMLPEPVVLLDAGGRVKYWSPAAETMFGWRAGEVTGQPPPFMTAAHVGEHLDILAATRRDSPIRERIVSRRAKDGRFRTLSLYARATPLGDVLMVFRPAEPSRTATVADTGPSNAQLETLGRMILGVSHDFNNVLAAIVGSGDLLAERVPLHSPDREWVEVIRTAGRHAAGLTKRLLQFARPGPVSPSHSDLSAVVKDLQPLVKALVPHGVRVKLQLGSNLPATDAGVTAIEQVVLNLAINAGQAMPRGGVLQIRTSAGNFDGRRSVVLAVADTGSGMDDDTRARLFEPFFTTRGCGTGLGLSTVRELVAETGGRIDVDSIPGMGSVFRVHFPATAAEPIDEQFNGRTALVVDDDPVIREIMKRALESVGYDVSEAASGDEAVMNAHWLHNALDLVVTDVVMPALGGRKLVEKLRATRPDLAVVFVSGYRQMKEECAENTRFLAKPFTGRQLIAAVRTLELAEV